MREKIRIGCGAGFSGDRLEPALVLAEQAELDYLVLECLAERTIALAQKRKMQDSAQGYDPLLERRIRSLLPIVVKNKICLISNMGAANPIAGAQKIRDIAQEQGMAIRVAAITGDDVLDKIDGQWPSLETGEALASAGSIISANAYLGVAPILEALQQGAQIILTGRVADPSLFLAPMIHEFGWSQEDYTRLGQGTVVGHLLECAGHITGGYFADPLKKPVPGMENLGHPFADVFPDGSAIISKVEGTGGVINLQTAKEQLLYEVINPFEYYTPDVVADFTTVQLQAMGPNQVKAFGGSGKARPTTYKVSVGYKAFFLGEGEISYAGAAALERATLAGEILENRLKGQFPDLRIDYIGCSSVHRTHFGSPAQPYEIRMRAAAKAENAQDAGLIGEEVEALYTNGPAGGGGVRKGVNEVIGILSVLLDRQEVQPQVHHFTVLENRNQ